MKNNCVNILGTLVHNISLDEAVRYIEQQVYAHRHEPEANPPQMIVTANPEYVMLARRDPAFQGVINNAGLVTPDGIGLIYAGKWLGTPFKGRVTGVALVQALAQRAAILGGNMTLFLLGAAEGVAAQAAAKLQAAYPDIQIVGTYAGIAGAAGDSEALARIQAAQPDIILVAYGQQKQDWWIVRNLAQSGAAVAMGVGGVFDYLSGNAKLAPLWVRRLGLEWLYRLYREPWRWRRQTALLHFILAVIRERFS